MKQQLGEIQQVSTHGVREDLAELSETSNLVRALQL